MRFNPYLLAGIVITIAWIGGLGWWISFQWSECRDSGLSFWYCVQHVAL